MSRKTCSSCGAETRNLKAVFCPSCGVKFPVAPDAQVSDASQQGSSPAQITDATPAADVTPNKPIVAKVCPICGAVSDNPRAIKCPHCADQVMMTPDEIIAEQKATKDAAQTKTAAPAAQANSAKQGSSPAKATKPKAKPAATKKSPVVHQTAPADVIHCPACSAEQPVGTLFCKKCGAPMSGTATPVTDTTAPTQPAPDPGFHINAVSQTPAGNATASAVAPATPVTPPTATASATAAPAASTPTAIPVDAPVVINNNPTAKKGLGCWTIGAIILAALALLFACVAVSAYQLWPRHRASAPAATPTVATAVPSTSSSKITVSGKSVGTTFDNRVTSTTGEVLTGHGAPYSGSDLTKVETTWLTFSVNPAPGEQISVFAFAVKFNGQIYDKGALFYLGCQPTTVEILNGEVVIWRDLSAMHTDISARISTEIQNGNLSISGPLAFSWLSQEFSGYIPPELIASRKVTIVK